MVPFTIFHRLSSLGSGGGVKAGTIPPFAALSRTVERAEQRWWLRSVLLQEMR
jgi:hypothetical protein